MLHAWIKNIQRLSNIIWRILSSIWTICISLIPNEHPVSPLPLLLHLTAPLCFFINKRDWSGVQMLDETQWTSSWILEKQSWNLPCNFQDLKKVWKMEIKSEKNDKKILRIFVHTFVSVYHKEKLCPFFYRSHIW